MRIMKRWMRKIFKKRLKEQREALMLENQKLKDKYEK